MSTLSQNGQKSLPSFTFNSEQVEDNVSFIHWNSDITKRSDNEVLAITNGILQPSQSHDSEMYETEPRYNKPQYNEIQKQAQTYKICPNIT